MRLSKNFGRPGGYTMVEVMIFLAVSGAIFAATAAIFSGQNGRAQFSTGAREMESRVQDLINDVSTGFYSQSGSVSCERSGTQPRIDVTDQAQGTNQDCIFIGRVAHFNIFTTGGEQYKTYSVVGLRQYLASGGARDVENFDEAQPRSAPELVETGQLPSPLIIDRIEYSTGSGAPIRIAGFGVFSGFGSRDPSSGNLQPGSLTTNLVPLGSFSPSSQNDMINSYIRGITTANAAATQNPRGGIKVCMRSSGGLNSQQAILTVGGNNKRLTTDMEISDGNCTAALF